MYIRWSVQYKCSILCSIYHIISLSSHWHYILLSKFILPERPQDYLWSHYPRFPSLLRTLFSNTLCLSKTNLFSHSVLAHLQLKFLTQVLWCQTVSTCIFFNSYLKSCFLCSCPTSTWSLEQLQPLELPCSWWTSISYLPDVSHVYHRISLWNITSKYFIFQLNV